MLDTSIQVKTERFDGPLALLLLLIQKQEMDIRKLDLTLITKQYLDYLVSMKELNFDIAGEYLFMASTLVLLKSKECITEEDLAQLKNSDEEMVILSQSDLVRRLEELAHFQRMGQKIWTLPRKGETIFVKPKIDRKGLVNSILMPMEQEKLISAMMSLLERNRRKFTVVARDRLTIKEKLVFLKGFLVKGQQCTLDDILKNSEDDSTLDNTIISFISLLELARLKKIAIFQNEAKSAIYVDVLEDLSSFNVDDANGFGEEEEQTEELLESFDESEEAIESSEMIFIDGIHSSEAISGQELQ